MKIFIKLMILALVLSYASLFVIKKPDGTPIRTLDSLKPDLNFSGLSEGLSESVDSVRNIISTETQDTTGNTMQVEVQQKQLYRWQDENGVWNYSDSPPPDVNAEAMALQAPNVMNLNPSVVITEDVQVPDETDAEPGLIPQQIREMQQTMQRAEEVSTQFRERLEEQQRMLEEL